MPPLSNPQKVKILQLRHQGLGVRRTWIKLGELWPDVKFNQGTVGKWWHRAGTQFQQECNLQRKVHTSAISQDCRPITMHEWLGPILCTIQILCKNRHIAASLYWIRCKFVSYVAQMSKHVVFFLETYFHLSLRSLDPVASKHLLKKKRTRCSANSRNVGKLKRLSLPNMKSTEKQCESTRDDPNSSQMGATPT